MPTLQRRGPAALTRPDDAKGRPVMLATMDVPFASDAVVFAVDSAVELGQRLIIANFVERAPLPLSAMLGYDDLPDRPELTDSLLAPVALAQSLGLEVTRLRVKSFHPARPCWRCCPRRVRGSSCSARTADGSGGCDTCVPSAPFAAGPPPWSGSRSNAARPRRAGRCGTCRGSHDDRESRQRPFEFLLLVIV